MVRHYVRAGISPADADVRGWKGDGESVELEGREGDEDVVGGVAVGGDRNLVYCVLGTFGGGWSLDGAFDTVECEEDVAYCPLSRRHVDSGFGQRIDL